MINIGFVGAGSVIQSHIDAAVISHFVPRVICGQNNSIRAKKISENNPGLSFARNLDELLDFNLDALVIALPASPDLSTIESCLERNIPLLIEKPVTTNHSELKELARLNLNRVRVGYNRRFYSSVSSFRSDVSVESGFVQVTIPELSTVKKSTIQDKIKATLANSVHIFDLLNFIFGRVRLSNISPIVVKGDLLAIRAQIESAQGVTGHLNVLFNVPENYSLKYWNSSLNLELCPIERYQKSTRIEVESLSNNNLAKTYSKKIENWSISDSDKLLKPGFLGQYRDFHNLVIGKVGKCSSANLQDALIALEMGLELVGSLKDLKVVTL